MANFDFAETFAPTSTQVSTEVWLQRLTPLRAPHAHRCRPQNHLPTPQSVLARVASFHNERDFSRCLESLPLNPIGSMQRASRPLFLPNVPPIPCSLYIPNAHVLTLGHPAGLGAEGLAASDARDSNLRRSPPSMSANATPLKEKWPQRGSITGAVSPRGCENETGTNRRRGNQPLVVAVLASDR